MPKPEELLAAKAHLRAPGSRVFSVFNIGTAHSQAEVNNTIAALWKDCEGNKLVNDGPGGDAGSTSHKFVHWAQNQHNALVGGGMKDALQRTVAAIKQANPEFVNMTGHSRGAILCHMIAHALFQDPGTKNLKISMMVIDPVHQSKIPHPGAEEFDNNPNLLSYHAIIMQHEESKMAYPFKFVIAPASVSERMHYIPMPGKHGSGTQNLTSPVGKVVCELIKTYMSARMTRFSSGPRTPMEMCELFAQIHVLNPVDVLNAQRLIFDDGGSATEHNPKNQKLYSMRVRAEDLMKAFERNSHTRQMAGQKVLPGRPGFQYFFNQEHAFYFKACFPYFFRIFAAAPLKTKMDINCFTREFALMNTRPRLAQGAWVLYAQLMEFIE